MELKVVRTDCTEHATPLLVVKVFEGTDSLIGPASKVDAAMGGMIGDVLATGDFTGKEAQTLMLFPAKGSTTFERVLLVGLGKVGDFNLERLRRASATALKRVLETRIGSFSLLIHHAELSSETIGPQAAGRAVAEGLVLGGYRFDQFKRGNEDEAPGSVNRVEILEKEPGKADQLKRGVTIGSAMAAGENFARTLGNLPGNVATPAYLGDQAREIADRFEMKLTVLGRSELQDEGMGALLAVSQGSAQEPRLIILEHLRGPEGGDPLVLIGKGLTFDAGGISIKPSLGMQDMKFDMCGGAAVLGAMHTIGELEVAANVVAIVPSSENLLSGEAMKPGDIITSHQGTTIEVVNTDAEGRLILADALSYAKRFHPAAIVDAATLTGSCVIALGNQASAGMTNNEDLLTEVRAAGERVGERVWELPMYPEYRDQIKSDYADIKNSGGRPAGSITAGWFLREFVGDVPWVHLDVAGTAYGDGELSYQSKGATGVPARMLAEWVLANAAQPDAGGAT